MGDRARYEALDEEALQAKVTNRQVRGAPPVLHSPVLHSPCSMLHLRPRRRCNPPDRRRGTQATIEYMAANGIDTTDVRAEVDLLRVIIAEKAAAVVAMAAAAAVAPAVRLWRWPLASHRHRA